MNEVGGKLDEESARQCRVRPEGQVEGGHLSIGLYDKKVLVSGQELH